MNFGKADKDSIIPAIRVMLSNNNILNREKKIQHFEEAVNDFDSICAELKCKRGLLENRL